MKVVYSRRNEKRMTTMNPKILKLFFVTTIWGILMASFLELSDQEAYYWSWSRILDWCYYEHPPLQAWFTRLFTSVLGNDSWAVRSPIFVLRALGFYFFWKWAKLHLQNTKLDFALWTIVGSFFFLSSAFLALPDIFAFPFAMATLYYTEKKKAWHTGLALGLAGLGKWTAVTFLPAVLIYYRHSKKDLFKIFLSAGLLQLPVLYWNSQNQWASFAFHLKKRHEEHSVTLLQLVQNTIAFLGSQVMLGGLAFIVLLTFFLMYFSGKKKTEASSTPKTDPLLKWWFMPAFVIFGLSASRGELRFYWTGLSFFPLIVWLISKMSDSYAHHISARFFKLQERLIYATMLLISFVLFFPVGHYLKPLTDPFKNFDLRHSPRGDLIGWQTFVEEELQPQGWLEDDVVYMASDFRLAAQMAWAARVKQMTQVGTWREDQFQFEFWPHPSPSRYKRAVFFGDNRRKTDNIPNEMCGHGIQWKSKMIYLHGFLVKEISWATCNQFQLHEHAKRHWKF